MKRITLLLGILILSTGMAMAQKKKVYPNNLTGTISFIPDNSLAIQTKSEKIFILVPDEDDLDVIFTTTSQELFDLIGVKIPKLNGSLLKIRGTKLGSLSKIFPQQFKTFTNKYKRRGLKLNAETNVYRISGYKVVAPEETTSTEVINPPSIVVGDTTSDVNTQITTTSDTQTTPQQTDKKNTEPKEKSTDNRLFRDPNTGQWIRPN